MIIYYLITLSCNLNCLHCIRGMSKKQFMDTKLALKGFDNIHKVFPDATIILSGGEPTIHPDFKTILDYSLSKFNKIVINSNGTTNYFSESSHWFSSKICIQFSLDGVKNGHESVRGRGTFDKVIKNINYINKLNFPIWISTVVSKRNIESVKELPMFLSKFNVEKWQVAPMIPFGKASDADLLSSFEWNNLVDYLISNTPFRLGISKLFSFEKLKEFTEEQLIALSNSQGNMQYRNCGCITNKLYVYPDFSIHPCSCSYNDNLGDLIYDDFTNLIQQSFKNRFVCTNSICQECKYFKICNGGCVGMQKKYGYDIRCPIFMALSGSKRV